jgi:hypothetical protein
MASQKFLIIEIGKKNIQGEGLVANFYKVTIFLSYRALFQHTGRAL